MSELSFWNRFFNAIEAYEQGLDLDEKMRQQKRLIKRQNQAARKTLLTRLRSFIKKSIDAGGHDGKAFFLQEVGMLNQKRVDPEKTYSDEGIIHPAGMKGIDSYPGAPKQITQALGPRELYLWQSYGRYMLDHMGCTFAELMDRVPQGCQADIHRFSDLPLFQQDGIIGIPLIHDQYAHYVLNYEKGGGQRLWGDVADQYAAQCLVQNVKQSIPLRDLAHNVYIESDIYKKSALYLDAVQRAQNLIEKGGRVLLTADQYEAHQIIAGQFGENEGNRFYEMCIRENMAPGYFDVKPTGEGNRPAYILKWEGRNAVQKKQMVLVKE